MSSRGQGYVCVGGGSGEGVPVEIRDVTTLLLFHVVVFSLLRSYLHSQKKDKNHLFCRRSRIQFYYGVSDPFYCHLILSSFSDHVKELIRLPSLWITFLPSKWKLSSYLSSRDHFPRFSCLRQSPFYTTTLKHFKRRLTKTKDLVYFFSSFLISFHTTWG